MKGKTMYIKLTFFTLLLFSFMLSFGSISSELSMELQRNEYLIKLRPQDAGAHFLLAMSYAYCGYVEEGFNELKEVSRLDSDFAKKAIEKYEKKIQVDPMNWRNYFYVAFANYFLEKKDISIELFKKVAELKGPDPISAWAYGYISVIYADRKEWEKSIEILTTAIKWEPDGTYLYLAMGYAQKEGGHTLEAVKYLIKGASMKAKNVIADDRQKERS